MRRTWLCVLGGVVAATAGCVERHLVIRTEPTDALVIVDDTEIGRSPATMNFTFYGTRKVTLKREGYATTVRFAEVKPPWYEHFPLDFISEILLPTTIVDRHEFTFTLEKPAAVDEEALLDRAEAMRREVREP